MFDLFRKKIEISSTKEREVSSEYERLNPDFFGSYRMVFLFDTEEHYRYHIEKLGEAIAENPRNPCLINNRGVAYSEMGDERAIADFNGSLEIAEHWVPYRNLADLYARGKMHDEELFAISKAIEINSQEATILRHRAHFYEKRGSLNEAIVDLSKAILLEPDFAYSYYERSTYYKSIGELELAKFDENKYEILKAKA